MRKWVSAILGIAILGAGVFGLVEADFAGKSLRVFTYSSSVTTANGRTDARDGKVTGQELIRHENRESGTTTGYNSIVKLDDVALWFLVFAFFVSATVWVGKGIEVVSARGKTPPSSRQIE